jgi:hypothetical protein
MSTIATRTRRTGTRLAMAAAVTGAAAALSLTGAAAASASTYASITLAPGQGVCTPAQYAGYQVRAEGQATGQGAKFKLLRDGQVYSNTANRAQAWATELRRSYGTFPGPGYYAACAQNTGTTNTVVTIQLRTDGEL